MCVCSLRSGIPSDDVICKPRWKSEMIGPCVLVDEVIVNEESQRVLNSEVPHRVSEFLRYTSLDYSESQIIHRESGNV